MIVTGTFSILECRYTAIQGEKFFYRVRSPKYLRRSLFNEQTIDALKVFHNNLQRLNEKYRCTHVLTIFTQKHQYEVLHQLISRLFFPVVDTKSSTWHGEFVNCDAILRTQNTANLKHLYLPFD